MLWRIRSAQYRAGRLGVNSAAGNVEALSSRNQTATPLILNRTAKGKQDMGSSRQIQFGLVFDF